MWSVMETVMLLCYWLAWPDLNMNDVSHEIHVPKQCWVFVIDSLMHPIMMASIFAYLCQMMTYRHESLWMMSFVQLGCQ